MWALIGEIDKARNGDRSNDDWEIYLEALVRAGAKYTHLLVEPMAESMLRDSFRAIQLVRRIKLGDKVFNDYKCFYGSSKLDKKEMDIDEEFRFPVNLYFVPDDINTKTNFDIMKYLSFADGKRTATLTHSKVNDEINMSGAKLASVTHIYM